MRYRIWAFVANRYWNGCWPEWLWDRLERLTFVSAYSVDGDEEIPF
jgi:hypothetical protein